MQLLKESLQVYKNNIFRIIGRSIVSFIFFSIWLFLAGIAITVILASITYFPVNYWLDGSYESVVSEGITLLSVILGVIVCAPILLGIYQAVNASVSQGNQHHSLKVYYRGKHRVRNIITAGIYFGVIIALWTSFRNPDADILFLDATWNPLWLLSDTLRTQSIYINTMLLVLILLPVLFLSSILSMTPYILADTRNKDTRVHPFLLSVKLLKGKYLKLFMLRVGIVLLFFITILVGLPFVGVIGDQIGEIMILYVMLMYVFFVFFTVVLIIPLYLIAHGIIYHEIREKTVE